MDDILARFAAEHLDRNSISDHRRKASGRVLAALVAQLGERGLDDLQPSDVMTWQAAELRRGLSPNTLRNRTSMVAAFVTWAYSAGIIDFERFTRLKSVPPVRGSQAHLQPKPYKRSEVEALRAALAARYPLVPLTGRGSLMLKRYLQGRSPFRGALYCHSRRLQLEAQVSLALEEGLRASEVWGMTLARLHPDNDGVVVLTRKQGPGVERFREVPWTTHSRQAVADWLALRELLAPEHEAVWLALTYGAPLAPQNYETSFARALEPFGYRWHRLRHTFATERLRAGMSLEQVQVMMGHASLTQTLAYAEIVNGDVRTQAEASETAFAEALGLAA